MSDESDEKHYFHTDCNKKEWEFLEINGTSKNYYFKCSTGRCKGFEMINRIDKSVIFRLTKKHTLDYYSHTYYKKIICAKELLDENIT